MSPIDDNLAKLSELKDTVKHQWDWVQEAAAPATKVISTFNATDENNWLRVKVRSSRVAVESACAAVTGALTSKTSAVTNASSSVSSSFEEMKDKAFALRRENPSIIVAGITILAVGAAYRPGPVPYRAMLRNAVVGSCAAAFFFYPEFVARTAPYVNRVSLDASKHANKAAERFGLIKNGGDSQQ
ncbi:hypothetical protein T492DRAFT_981315 [Pavlovales sp. CCMP2436]|nr:hypothetical protein T492DRAFT_981315 [Pavlovales sp. CCMP2436]|mmetsp:Transcript_11974/g.30156  ORF Transcript_11974/g.30156 Transcript_11974/m.30156 type:complete len:186 (-) Transcript_11974:262-819(-)